MVFVLSLKFHGCILSPQEFNNYARAQKPNALNGVGAGLAQCLELESVSALCVAVWGYPQFAAGDQVTTVTNNVTTVTNNVTNVVTIVSNVVTTVTTGDPVLLPGSPGGHHPPPPARRQAAL